MNPQGKGKIEWTDQSWNPVTGCLGPCSYCYARRTATEGRAKKFYPNGFVPEFHPERLVEPSKLKKPSKIFVGDMTDLFRQEIPDEWIDAVWGAMDEAPRHTYQMLTKRPVRYNDWAFEKNIWLGTTWDGLEETKGNVDVLAGAWNDSIKFVSFEPLLAPYEHELPVDALDWIIIGEETGRALTQEEIHNIWQWAGDLIDQAKKLDIPVFVKNQLGQTYKQREYPR